MKRALLPVLIATSSRAIACSGPGTQESMMRAWGFGWIGFGILAVSSVFMFRWYRVARKGPGHPLAILLLLAIHPTWYVGVGSGDCGMGLEWLTQGMLLLNVALIFWQLSLVAKHKEKLASIAQPTADEQGFAPYPRHSDHCS